MKIVEGFTSGSNTADPSINHSKINVINEENTCEGQKESTCDLVE
jgi:hypothetical protein